MPDTSPPLYSLCYRELNPSATNVFYAQAETLAFPGFSPSSATELMNWVVEVQFFARKHGCTEVSFLAPAGQTIAYRRMPAGHWIEAQLFTLMEALIDG